MAQGSGQQSLTSHNRVHLNQALAGADSSNLPDSVAAKFRAAKESLQLLSGIMG
jgi:hypothetical protein